MLWQTIDPIWFAALVALLVPLVVALVANAGWSGRAKDFAALIFCGLVGAGTALVQNKGAPITPEALVTLSGVALVSAKLTYFGMRKLGFASNMLDWIAANLGNTSVQRM